MTSENRPGADPCRLVRQVKEFGRCVEADKLIHPPGELAGVLQIAEERLLAVKLIHLPDEPAGASTETSQNCESLFSCFLAISRQKEDGDKLSADG